TDDLPGILVSAGAGILALGIHEFAFFPVDSRAKSQAVGQTGRTTGSPAFDGSQRDDETDQRRQTPARYLCALRNFRLRLALAEYEYSRCGAKRPTIRRIGIEDTAGGKHRHADIDDGRRRRQYT